MPPTANLRALGCCGDHAAGASDYSSEQGSQIDKF